MWQQKVLYDGNASEECKYDPFRRFMEGKGLRIGYRNTSVCKKDLYIIGPATTLTYTTRRRMVPRDLDLWHVTITISGYAVEEVEKDLQKLISEQKS